MELPRHSRRKFWSRLLLVLPLLLPLTAAAETYTSATLDSKGQLQLVTADQRHIRPKKIKDQVAFEAPRISPDGKTVGWLTLHPNCCTSYPIPLILVIYRGKVFRMFTGNGTPIWAWGFVSGGSRVAFSQQPTHGPFEPHFELRSVESGRLVEEYDPASQEIAPEWVKNLEKEAKCS